ncbi:MAG: hypothetical protein K2I53_13635 [Lachnospiraceae bacterium]|nr:hypothetical protein [Lachnospiraceae bacterium]
MAGCAASKLLVIKPVRDTVGGDCLFQHLLETVGIVAVGHACADDEAGMVVDDDGQIDLMGLFIRGIVDVTEEGVAKSSKLDDWAIPPLYFY